MKRLNSGSSYKIESVKCALVSENATVFIKITEVKNERKDGRELWKVEGIKRMF